ncbi:MAG: glycosyltransferase family 9 protein [Syntrophaceae bacterium]
MIDLKFIKKVLFVPMDRIGDAISDTPAISFLTSKGISVSVLATPYTEAIFKNNPNVNNVLVYHRPKREGLIAYLKNLGVARQVKLVSPDIIFGMMRPIRELRYIYKISGVRVENKPQDESQPIYMRWVSYFKTIWGEAKPGSNEIYPGEEDIKTAIDWAKETGLDLTMPFIVIHPGCAVYKNQIRINETVKYWHADKFIEIIQSLPKEYSVILTGINHSEIIANQYIRDKSQRKVGLFTDKNIRSLAWLISKSKLLLTLDTGTLHVGAATCTPVIAIFGPTTPEKYGPFGNNIRYVRTKENIVCWPCDQNPVCKGNNICMTSLNAETVKKVVLESLTART